MRKNDGTFGYAGMGASVTIVTVIFAEKELSLFYIYIYNILYI